MLSFFMACCFYTLFHPFPLVRVHVLANKSTLCFLCSSNWHWTFHEKQLNEFSRAAPLQGQWWNNMDSVLLFSHLSWFCYLKETVSCWVITDLILVILILQQMWIQKQQMCLIHKETCKQSPKHKVQYKLSLVLFIFPKKKKKKI